MCWMAISAPHLQHIDISGELVLLFSGGTGKEGGFRVSFMYPSKKRGNRMGRWDMKRSILWWGGGCLIVGIVSMAAWPAEAGPPSRWSDSGGTSSSTIEDIDEEVPAAVPVQTPAGPVMAPPAPSPQTYPPPSSYGARVSTLPPSSGGAPPPSVPSSSRAARASAPPPPPPGSTAITPTRSDLPHGWEDPVYLPPGAVPLEKVRSPHQAAPNWPTASQPPASAAGAPAMPVEEEVMEDTIDKATKPPSRWQ